MNENLDYLFNEEQETPTDKAATERLSDEDYAAKKDAERKDVNDLVEQSTQAVATNGTKLQAYLNTLSRFDLYSTVNTLLIFAQRPNATRLREYDKWVEAGTPVKKSQKGISIFDEKKTYERADGTTGYKFPIIKRFDISQTSAKIEPPKALNIKLLCQALIKSSTAKVILVDALDGVSKRAESRGAEYIPENDQIEIVRGLDGESIFRVLSQEVAYANLAHIEADKLQCTNIDFTAYAASYVVCQKYGIDTKDYDFTDAPSHFAKVDDKDLRNEIGAIRDTVADMTGAMSKSIGELQKQAKNQEAR